VETTSTVTALGGVALVAVTLYNDTAADLRVRIENELDGPVLPPRQEGVPAAGWDDGGYTGVIPAAGRLGVGYACPVGEVGTGVSVRTGVDSTPVSVELLGPADSSGNAPADPIATTVRWLGRAAPPMDAVPAATREPDGAAYPAGSRRGSEGDHEAPDPVVTWLDAVEQRVERAERFTDATADDAATALGAYDGIDGVAALPSALEEDAETLRRVRRRVDDLASRASKADPGPVASALVEAAESGGSREAVGRTDPDSASSREANRGSEASRGGSR
jgi:hypothetical protein